MNSFEISIYLPTYLTNTHYVDREYIKQIMKMILTCPALSRILSIRKLPSESRNFRMLLVISIKNDSSSSSFHSLKALKAKDDHQKASTYCCNLITVQNTLKYCQ